MNPRLAAARALATVLQGKASLGSSLPPLLDKVEPRDRGLAQELAFGTARIFADPLVEIFVPAGSEVELLAASGLQLFSLSFLACGFNIFTQGFFTALSQGHLSALGSCARGLVGISFFLIVLPPILGIRGIWLAVPAADASVLLLSFWLLHSYMSQPMPTHSCS